MLKDAKHTDIFSTRLREARLRLGVSQMQLGVLAGIDEYSASARMNQYERGKHLPDLVTLRNLARVLKVPVAYFFAETEEEAYLLLSFYKTKKSRRKSLVKQAIDLFEADFL